MERMKIFTKKLWKHLTKIFDKFRIRSFIFISIWKKYLKFLPALSFLGGWNFLGYAANSIKPTDIFELVFKLDEMSSPIKTKRHASCHFKVFYISNVNLKMSKAHFEICSSLTDMIKSQQVVWMEWVTYNRRSICIFYFIKNLNCLYKHIKQIFYVSKGSTSIFVLQT